MEFDLVMGTTYEVEITVEDQHTAEAFGSGGIKVLATPMMITLMENAAMKAVESQLPEGYSTVGTHLDVKHIAATPVGVKVRAKAELSSIEGKRLTFKVEAYDERDKIGEGIHERYIVEVEKFLKRIHNK